MPGVYIVSVFLPTAGVAGDRQKSFDSRRAAEAYALRQKRSDSRKNVSVDYARIVPGWGMDASVPIPELTDAALTEMVARDTKS